MQCLYLFKDILYFVYCFKGSSSLHLRGVIISFEHLPSQNIRFAQPLSDESNLLKCQDCVTARRHAVAMIGGNKSINATDLRVE